MFTPERIALATFPGTWLRTEDEMTDTLKIFGREMKLAQPHWHIVRHELLLGMFMFRVEEVNPGQKNGYILAGINTNLVRDEVFEAGEAEKAVAFLESEARRIMRECFEIAGPMMVTVPLERECECGATDKHSCNDCSCDKYEVEFRDE